MQEETKKNTKKQQSGQYRMYLIAVVVLALVGGGAYFGWTKWQERQASPEIQAAKAEEEKQEIIKSISKLMILPEGDPVLFKVNNEDQMRSQQAFFKDTKNDDVLLVYQEAQKAVLFRPSNNTIVNVGPINFDNTSSAGQQTSQVAPVDAEATKK